MRRLWLSGGWAVLLAFACVARAGGPIVMVQGSTIGGVAQSGYAAFGPNPDAGATAPSSMNRITLAFGETGYFYSGPNSTGNRHSVVINGTVTSPTAVVDGVALNSITGVTYSLSTGLYAASPYLQFGLSDRPNAGGNPTTAVSVVILTQAAATQPSGSGSDTRGTRTAGDAAAAGQTMWSEQDMSVNQWMFALFNNEHQWNPGDGTADTNLMGYMVRFDGALRLKDLDDASTQPTDVQQLPDAPAAPVWEKADLEMPGWEAESAHEVKADTYVADGKMGGIQSNIPSIRIPMGVQLKGMAWAPTEYEVKPTDDWGRDSQGFVFLNAVLLAITTIGCSIWVLDELKRGG